MQYEIPYQQLQQLQQKGGSGTWKASRVPLMAISRLWSHPVEHCRGYPKIRPSYKSSTLATDIDDNMIALMIVGAYMRPYRVPVNNTPYRRISPP